MIPASYRGATSQYVAKEQARLLEARKHCVKACVYLTHVSRQGKDKWTSIEQGKATLESVCPHIEKSTYAEVLSQDISALGHVTEDAGELTTKEKEKACSANELFRGQPRVCPLSVPSVTHCPFAGSPVSIPYLSLL